MPLHKKYPENFERIWAAYPTDWKAGRSEKAPAFKQFEIAAREFKFDDHDIDELVRIIEDNKLHNETWQAGSRFGPPSLQKWIRSRRWQTPFVTVTEAKSSSEDRWDKANRAETDIDDAEAMSLIRVENPDLYRAIMDSRNAQSH